MCQKNQTKAYKKPLPSISFRHEDAWGGSCSVAGVDEVGYGAWAGPIVVAAAWINRVHVPLYFLEKLRDSKRLGSKKRQEIYDLFIKNPLWGAYTLQAVEIPQIIQGQVLAHTLHAMAGAVVALSDQVEEGIDAIIVDGRHAVPLEYWVQKSIPGGDATSYTVALASIMAKVARDTLMVDLSQEYPEFLWNQNKGYGTLAHQKAIQQFGLSPHHREFYCRRCISVDVNREFSKGADLKNLKQNKKTESEGMNQKE